MKRSHKKYKMYLWNFVMGKTHTNNAEPNVWMKVHHIVWEAHNGPIPDGHVVVFRDGNTANIEIENLHCLPRGELGMANGACVPYHLTDAYRLMRELQQTIEESDK